LIWSISVNNIEGKETAVACHGKTLSQTQIEWAKKQFGVETGRFLVESDYEGFKHPEYLEQALILTCVIEETTLQDPDRDGLPESEVPEKGAPVAPINQDVGDFAPTNNSYMTIQTLSALEEHDLVGNSTNIKSLEDSSSSTPPPYTEQRDCDAPRPHSKFSAYFLPPPSPRIIIPRMAPSLLHSTYLPINTPSSATYWTPKPSTPVTQQDFVQYDNDRTATTATLTSASTMVGPYHIRRFENKPPYTPIARCKWKTTRPKGGEDYW